MFLLVAHQYDRTDQLGHDRLHGEALVVHGRDWPGQCQLQAVPVKKTKLSKELISKSLTLVTGSLNVYILQRLHAMM